MTLAEPLPQTVVDAEFAGVNAFHEAVVVQVDAPALPGLPHMTIGYVRRPGPAAPLREAVQPMRETRLGREALDELLHVRVPAARSTFLRPWTVLGRVSLRR